MIIKKQPLDYQAVVFIFCGVAENRTRVQTSNQRAFYTLSFLLNFRPLAWQKTATKSLASKISKCQRDNNTFRFTLRFPLTKRHKPRLFRRIQLFHLVETKGNLTIIQIKQLKRNYFRRLKSSLDDIYEQSNNARRAY